MFRKKLFLIFLLVIIGGFLCTAKALSDSDYQVRSETNFQVYFPQGLSILFQMDTITYNHVALDPVIGNLNGTNGQLWMAEAYGGKFSFTAQENATLLLTESLGGVRINGEGYGTGSNYTIYAGNVYTFEWSYVLAPMLPFSFLLGVIGLGMLFGGPIYTIHQFRQHEYRSLITGTVITLVGAALIIGWFWS